MTVERSYEKDYGFSIVLFIIIIVFEKFISIKKYVDKSTF
jgi:hypothetical protein